MSTTVSSPITTENGTVSMTTQDPTSGTSWDDATWILTSAFIIFTMQSGFGLLESGTVSEKNEVNIMAKNVADVVFGGISYWMLGYGLSFGDGEGSNGFCGSGKFFVDPDDDQMGDVFSKFVFQSSFATTATTIVSGAIAERTKYVAYIVFSFFNTFVFCFPAHWVWAPDGWLKVMGVVDVAGDGPVHLVGGVTALVGALLVKPRARRYTSEDDHEMASPTNALLGLFILWWGWLAFNCGSTYGISNNKWKMAARAAATTLMSASMAGIVGFIASFIVNKGKFSVPFIINSILAGLVSITASCAVTGIWESLIIGGTGALICLLAEHCMNKLKIDDPVGAFAVHGVGGAWGLLATGIFGHEDDVAHYLSDNGGLVQTGRFDLLWIQILAVVTIAGWSALSSFIIFFIIDKTIGLRMSPEDEEMGADFCEHDIKRVRFGAMVIHDDKNEDEDNNNSDDSLQFDPDIFRRENGQPNGLTTTMTNTHVSNGNGHAHSLQMSPQRMGTVGKDIVLASRCFKFWKFTKKSRPNAVHANRTINVEEGPVTPRYRRNSNNFVYPLQHNFNHNHNHHHHTTVPSSNISTISFSSGSNTYGSRIG